MAWGDKEVSEQELMSRLAWFFQRAFREVGTTKIAQMTGISRSTIERYAVSPTEPPNEAIDEARVAAGKRPSAKAYPNAPRNLTYIMQITRALGYEFDHLIVALTRASDPDSFEIIMRSELVSEFVYQTKDKGEVISHVAVTRFKGRNPKSGSGRRLDLAS